MIVVHLFQYCRNLLSHLVTLWWLISYLVLMLPPVVCEHAMLEPIRTRFFCQNLTQRAAQVRASGQQEPRGVVGGLRQTQTHAASTDTMRELQQYQRQQSSAPVETQEQVCLFRTVSSQICCSAFRLFDVPLSQP